MTDTVARWIRALKHEAAQPDADIKRLHDDLCAFVARLRAANVRIPAALKALDDDLEAEIEESLYDNLPL
ncbi:hypothetical protein [Pseudoruegeria sp. SK021]|uniref:hypothetical protein n=1 Tax=Pseudoruegeria sp. SK021 TaxID=1933035 RepID=UPI000A25CC91|nr:hypothetical protein [Pseudoruegeria sp. SK021]OSP54934.1 hypothetical protein BV911_09800 [Pseudoruegeria sp. SK021]